MKSNEVLIKVQESFMQDRFLPLQKRRQLIAEIETIKKQMPITKTKNEVKEKNKASILSLISIIVTLITVMIGILSYYLRYLREKEKDEEIANQINESESFSIQIDSAMSYENKIINVLKNTKDVKLIENQKIDYGFDAMFEFRGETYFVECKYLIRSKVGLSSLERFVHQSRGLEGNLMFVYNTDLTTMVKSRVDELRKILFLNSRRKVFMIKATNEDEFKSELSKILK